jgi:hypothetical protein
MIRPAIELIVALVLLWITVFLFWRNYRIDRFRDQLFALRNELFDYAAQGGIPFNEPAYGILRNTMNGLLRYAERIGFIHVMLASITQNWKPSPVYEKMFQRWTLAINRLDDEQREAIATFNIRLSRIIISRVMSSSPLPLLVVFVYAVVSFLHKLFRGFERENMETRLKSSIEIVEAQALEAQTAQMKLAAA